MSTLHLVTHLALCVRGEGEGGWSDMCWAAREFPTIKIVFKINYQIIAAIQSTMQSVLCIQWNFWCIHFQQYSPPAELQTTSK